MIFWAFPIPAHGGSDPGAVASGVNEKDLNLIAANYMYDRFRKLGIPVASTRRTDESITREERINTMLNSFGNSPEVLILSNHINAGGGEGAEIYYPLRDDGVLAGNILREIGNEGQIMRGIFQRTLPEDPTRDYYYIQRLTPNTTALLLEYGFIDNPTDLRKLQENLLRYVEAVVRAVANYAGVPYTPPEISLNKDYIIYTVQNGDTLWNIAKKYNTTVNEIMRLNNLANSNIYPNQKLRVPVKKSEETLLVEYTVQPGDTLWVIANRYNTTVDEIKRRNNLTSDMLQINQKLLIPTSESNSNNNSNTGSNNGQYYTVAKDDSLWYIANKFGITVNQLMTANNLTNFEIQPGQLLWIPVAGPLNTYTVVAGDTLWKIANQFDTTVQRIQELNNLVGTTLQIGQILTIPDSNRGGLDEEMYTVKDEMLWQIADKFHKMPEEIMDYNNLQTPILQSGQTIKIPK